MVRFAIGATTMSAKHPTPKHLWRELRKLPARQTTGVGALLRRGSPVAEIAAMLECPEGTVKALLHRGRATLARALGDAYEEDGS